MPTNNQMSKNTKKSGAILRAILFFARHIILSSILIFFLSLSVAGGFVTLYSFLGEKKAVGISSDLFYVKEDIRKEVAGFWQEQAAKSQEAGSKVYPNPFLYATPEGEEKLD